MNNYRHSVVLIKERCTGCTTCMQNCPTKAIRIVEGKASILEDRCIDCGECLKVCPFQAKTAATDSFDSLSGYEYKVAIPSLSLFGQFPDSYTKEDILKSLLKIGFDEVIDPSLHADMLSPHLREIVCDETDIPKPIISTFCPSITRFIQLEYPSLIKNVIRLESPMEIAGREALRRISKEKGIPEDKIAVTFMAQCSAKVTSIKAPLGLDKSALNTAVSIREIYSKILKVIDKVDGIKLDVEQGCNGIKWARPHGQPECAGITSCISVDGIKEVSKILDMVETGILKNINYIDAFACVGGCMGGPLNVENPFISRYRLDKLCAECKPIDTERFLKTDRSSLCWNKEIKENKAEVIDNDFSKALEKMMKIEENLKMLPGKDCGACGSPSCRVLAEDAVLGRARISDCVFLKIEEERK